MAHKRTYILTTNDGLVAQSGNDALTYGDWTAANAAALEWTTATAHMGGYWSPKAVDPEEIPALVERSRVVTEKRLRAAERTER